MRRIGLYQSFKSRSVLFCKTHCSDVSTIPSGKLVGDPRGRIRYRADALRCAFRFSLRGSRFPRKRGIPPKAVCELLAKRAECEGVLIQNAFFEAIGLLGYIRESTFDHKPPQNEKAPILLLTLQVHTAAAVYCRLGDGSFDFVRHTVQM